MNLALWVVQGLLAVLFLMAGGMKLTQSKEKALASGTMDWVEDFSPAMLKVIGAFEVLGAIGLILPGITGIAPMLVPLAAVGLALVMVGAIITHVRRGETQALVMNAVILALSVFVAWGRFGDYAF